MDEFIELIKRSEMNLTLIIASTEPNLDYNNILYILEIDAESKAAGGRSAGFGSRRFKKIHGFHIKGKEWRKIVESDDVDWIEVSYVLRLPIILHNGFEAMASCSIDPDLIDILNKRFNISIK
ncbi:MAG: hypothetical protein QXK74_06890 [Candidatus Nitrosocaldaceae archaeon]